MHGDLTKAEDRDAESFVVKYDVSAKYFVLEKTRCAVKDLVHVDVSKAMVLTRSQLEKLVSDAKNMMEYADRRND